MSAANLKVRIYDIDWTLAAPGPLDNSNLRKVPVLRVFGDSSAGLKTCVHVHQVYPYFYVEYSGQVDAKSVTRYIGKLFRSLNKAIAISKRKKESFIPQYIRAIVLVKGIHFYGFHAGYSPFLKIYFADPGVVSRAVTIMRSGTIMGTKFRLFESHINFPLQFMCDFALYGCAWLELAQVWQRQERPLGLTQFPEEPINAPSNIFPLSTYFCDTRLPLEVDIAAHQILNRHRVNARHMHDKLNIPGDPLPSEPLVLSVRELWEDERARRIARGLKPSPEIPIDPSEASRGAGGNWVSEVQYWDELKRRIQIDGQEDVRPHLATSWERWVMTTFESIEALWEKPWRTWKPQQPNSASNMSKDPPGLHVRQDPNPFEDVITQAVTPAQPVKHDDVDIDESILSSQGITQLMRDNEAPQQPYEQDEEHVDGTELYEEENPELADDDVEGYRVVNGLGTPSKNGFETSSNRSPQRHAASVPTTPSRSSPVKKSTQLSKSTGKGQTSYLRALPGLAGSPLAGQALSERLLEAGPLKNHEVLSMNDGPSLDAAENPFINSSTPSKESANSGEPSQVPVDSSVDLLSSRTFSQTFRKRTQIPPPHTLVTSAASVFQYEIEPPTASNLLATIEDHGLQRRVYRSPWYSDPEDSPDGPREYAGLLYHLKGGEGLDTLSGWQTDANIAVMPVSPTYAASGGWEFAGTPPSASQTKIWLNRVKEQQELVRKLRAYRSQIRGPTATNRPSKNMPLKPGASSSREKQNLTIMGLEIFATSQDDRKPDPQTDEIAGIFYAFHDSSMIVTDPLSSALPLREGMIVVNRSQMSAKRLRSFAMECVADELEALNKVMDLIGELDPDVMAGYEVQTASWGYLRARCHVYGIEFAELASRGPYPNQRSGDENTEWGFRQSSTIKLIGRHMLNVWRIMRSEQNLRSYSFENVAFTVLHERFPYYCPATLTAWYNSPSPSNGVKLLQYFQDRTNALLRILDATEVVTKTAEFARVFGVDFFSVISRGSQYKVESFMIRIAKPESFVLLSPSREDVGKQNAIECIPLIMEPLSALYTSPLIVLDFQSLYPSIMIAYNYCYSTCLGRVRKFMDTNKFGVTELNLPKGLLGTLEDHITVAPNGMMYVKPHVRHGLLGRMLRELLQTRVMVKQAMKGVKDDKAFRRVLDARQLGLKFISNVTYGYTSATFSGRMPAVEIADSIVQSGRETLEKAIQVIHSTKKWNAKVVYGDTDSLFIYLLGKTKEQAFQIGYDISDTITAMNPAPIKLKFEKVYLPCVMMAKKRYVGFKYENPDDFEPVFDAKGIETVRRDGCAAQAKMTEQCLRILFKTRDLSQVKEYCYDSWYKIIDQRVTIQDFIFAKEVKMGTYSDRNPPPPGVTVAARRQLIDAQDEVQYGERVPYVIVRGEPGMKLLERAHDPRAVIGDPDKHLDSTYYISRVLIPPLERIFNLLGADVRGWYDEMPKSLRSDTAGNANPGVNGTPSANALSPKKVHADRAAANRVAIEGHLRNTQCLLCGAYTPSGLCQECYQARQPSMAALSEHVVRCEDRLRASHAVCGSCTASNPAEPVECESLDCQWFYERHKAERGMELATFAREVIAEMEEEKEWEEGRYWVNEEDPENMEHNGNDANLSDADAQSIATSDEWDGLYLDEDVL